MMNLNVAKMEALLDLLSDLFGVSTTDVFLKLKAIQDNPILSFNDFLIEIDSRADKIRSGE